MEKECEGEFKGSWMEATNEYLCGSDCNKNSAEIQIVKQL